jgi:hypothetical protein
MYRSAEPSRLVTATRRQRVTRPSPAWCSSCHLRRLLVLANALTIIIKPHKLTSTGMRYAAYLEDALLCRSKTPFLTAARVLLSQGVPAHVVLTMRHRGSSHSSLISTVGQAARLAVRETDTEGPLFVTYRSSLDSLSSTRRIDQGRAFGVGRHLPLPEGAQPSVH